MSPDNISIGGKWFSSLEEAEAYRKSLTAKALPRIRRPKGQRDEPVKITVERVTEKLIPKKLTPKKKKPTNSKPRKKGRK